MDVVSVSPFRTGSVLWRSRPDRWTLTVVCKGTYLLAPGVASLAENQDEVIERDHFWDDDTRLSIQAPSDLAPFKPRADVILVGHAYAPRSEMARSLVARLSVGEMEKAVEVTSPRVWTREGEMREGPRWNKMPLRYEYAAGGVHTWNPVGVSAHAAPDAYGQRLLPNLQPPELRITQWSDLFVPVGFGPIASTWRLRREKLGRRAEGWSDESWPQIPLEDDFDGEFFQAAPPDQQIETLHDDEAIVLEYLHPDHPRLATKLPGVRPHAFVDVPGSPPHDLVMTADTLWIDTDRGICTVTWRGQVTVEGPAHPGRVVIALEEPGERLTWTALGLAAQVPVDSHPPQTPLQERPAVPTLPFRLAESLRAQHAPTVPPAPEPEEAAHTPRAGGGRQPTLQMATTVEPPAAPAQAQPQGWRLGRTLDTEVTANVVVAEVRVPPPAGAALEVLWCSPALSGRLRKNAVWARLLTPGGPAKRNTMTMVSVAAPDTAEAAEQAVETDATTILARGKPGDADLEGALFDSIDGSGALVPELLLLSGELELPFDEVAWVNALATAAAPLARTDPHLAELLDHATELSRGPLPHAVAEGLAASIREAWGQANRGEGPDRLDEMASRSLLSQRAYQRRDVLGDLLVRALFTPAGTPSAVPAYLPEAAARRLPLFARLPVRLLADVVPQQDQYEESAVALRVGAIARVVTRSGRREG